MNFENGGEQPANDAVVANQNDAVPVADERDNAAVDLTEENRPAEDEEEFDVEGEKFRIPRKLREAIAKPMLADYTRKSQEHAEAVKAFEGEREGFTKQREAQRAHFETAAKVIAYNDQIKTVDASLAEYAKVDWQTLAQTNPALYEHHRVQRDMLRDQKDTLKEQRDTAARTWSEKEQEYASNANRERGERLAKAQAEVPKLIKEWSPELNVKLGQFGNAHGISNQEMLEATIQNPNFIKVLHMAFKADEAEKRQKTQQQFQASQAAQPVTRVGGNGGSAARKTTDATGDGLSTEEWVKRERERMRKQG